VRSAALDERHTARRANVLHPLRIISEHRHKVTLAFVACTDEDC
jgi:hypothetical protein